MPASSLARFPTW